jgi:hypothetical protein
LASRSSHAKITTFATPSAVTAVSYQIYIFWGLAVALNKEPDVSAISARTATPACSSISTVSAIPSVPAIPTTRTIMNSVSIPAFPSCSAIAAIAAIMAAPTLSTGPTVTPDGVQGCCCAVGEIRDP